MYIIHVHVHCTMSQIDLNSSNHHDMYIYIYYDEYVYVHIYLFFPEDQILPKSLGMPESPHADVAGGVLDAGRAREPWDFSATEMMTPEGKHILTTS